MYLLAICMSSLEKCLFKAFFSWVVCCCWVVLFLFIYWFYFFETGRDWFVVPPIDAFIGWFFFKKDFIYLFLERGEGREERETNINVWLPFVRLPLGTWPETQACALTGNWTSDPLIRRLALNPLSHTRQGHWLILICALTKDWTHSLGVSGQCSN